MVGHAGSGPLLVFGPRSLAYDFGSAHPLSPRRFGPGIDLLRAVGAEPALAPEPATDEQLEWLHSPEYVATVKRFSTDPGAHPQAGIGPGDNPAFAGMHEAAASVAGGSIAAMEAILRGDVEHAFQPGGGLHHAMRARASGFCIYNDPALAIARARQEGLRVLYVDLDVHHGDGVQALHAHDPGVLTVSFHETGRALFPGTGFVDELGEGEAAGTSINVPFEPLCGPAPWLDGVRRLVPSLAAAFGPDVVVSQHGADGHVWDPLAHLALTTTVIGEAARLVDRIAHRYGQRRWLATGGGGYSIYRVVPRTWALTWLAGAHAEVPDRLPVSWRERWSDEAAGFEGAELPAGFEDDPSLPTERLISQGAAVQAGRTVELVRTLAVPALLRAAEDRGWWQADGPEPAGPESSGGPGGDEAQIVSLTAEGADLLRLAPRTIAPASATDGMAIVRAALRAGAVAAGAVVGEWLVGVAIAVPASGGERRIDELVALGVTPNRRRGRLATALLGAIVEAEDRAGRALVARPTLAERDPFDPLPREVRHAVAGRLLAAFTPLRPPSGLAGADPDVLLAAHLPPGQPGELIGLVEAGFAGR